MPIALYEDQQLGVAKLQALNGRAGLFMEMGTGKTRTALAYADGAGARRVLVVCPLSVAGVWELECRDVGYSLPVVDLTEQDSLAKRAALLKCTGDALVVINYESYWREPLRKAILDWRPDTVILDEGHRIRHRGARQSRFAHALADQPFVTRRLLLTGTPITNGLQDAWSLYRFIDASVFGKRFVDFQNAYLMLGGWQGRQIVDYRNVGIARQRIDASSYQCKKRGLLGRRDQPIPVRLDSETLRVYAELKRRAMVEVADANGQPTTVVARIALTLLLRLQQLTSGFLRDVGADIVEVGDDKGRRAVELITDAIDGGERVVLFARFLHDIELVRSLLPPSVRVAIIQGGVPIRERKRIMAAFKAGEYDVVLGQIKTASEGIDLTAASVAIFMSVGYSLHEFLQAKDRIHRIGQTRDVLYYHLLAARTVDVRVYRDLQAKINIAGRLTSLTYALDLFSGN